MKQRIRLALFSCALLILATFLFRWNRSLLAAPVPTPSHAGGYYDNPFTLTLSYPAQGTVYYTTDGSTPTTDSPVYTGGILLENRSRQPNVYNSIRNVVLDWYNYHPDSQPVDKGTVVRAIYVSPGGISSEILTQTYFVGVPQPEQGYTLSLVFEEEDLFGKDGIYVTGQAYDHWMLSGGSGEAPQPNFEKKIEVPATAQLLSGGGQIFNQKIGLRLQGHSARDIPKKRMILTARTEYGGKQVFDAPIFPGIDSHSVMLKDITVDAMAAQLVSDRAVGVQRSVPVRLYLNGEYWLDTYILERYDSQYFRQHYDVPDRLRVKDGRMDKEYLETAPLDVYGEYMYWAEDADFSDPEEWEALLAETDVQSYIDYIAINYYLCNYDFSQWRNCFLWRSAGPGTGPWEDQRWRWCIYDVDAVDTVELAYPEAPAAQMDIFTCVVRQTDIVLNQNTLFRAFKQNSAYCQQFVTSFMDIGNNNFAPERVEKILAQYGLDLSWKGNYFLDRPAWAAKYLAKEFGLTGTLETVTVTTDPNMGSVQVNTSLIDLDDGSWSGQYFTDYPITLTAIPAQGYRFAGWRGSFQSTEQTLTCPMDGGVELEAVFVPD